MSSRNTILAVTLALLGGCIAAPPRYGEVVTMKAGERPGGDYPAPGTVWRLDENDLKALSPAPLVPAPPPPNYPPPRPNSAYPAPYYPPPPPPYWAPVY
jgi:hypothetical protein